MVGVDGRHGAKWRATLWLLVLLLLLDGRGRGGMSLGMRAWCRYIYIYYCTPEKSLQRVQAQSSEHSDLLYALTN